VARPSDRGPAQRRHGETVNATVDPTHVGPALPCPEALPGESLIEGGRQGRGRTADLPLSGQTAHTPYRPASSHHRDERTADKRIALDWRPVAILVMRRHAP
jgi:hypothetical protein